MWEKTWDNHEWDRSSRARLDFFLLEILAHIKLDIQIVCMMVCSNKGKHLKKRKIRRTNGCLQKSCMLMFCCRSMTRSPELFLALSLIGCSSRYLVCLISHRHQWCIMIISHIMSLITNKCHTCEQALFCLWFLPFVSYVHKTVSNWKSRLKSCRMCLAFVCFNSVNASSHLSPSIVLSATPTSQHPINNRCSEP